MGYCDLAYLKGGTLRPEDLIDIEKQYPGFLQGLIDDESAYIDARLRKRYAVPFSSPVPIDVKRWCRDLVLPRVLARRGANPSENDLREQLEKARDLAVAEIKEAADAQNGLFDLPLRADLPATSGLTAPAPMGYAEASPYDWLDVQDEKLSGR